jgi:hypothetical protein
MALNEDQIGELWECRIGAEVRALYFGDLARSYSFRKQGITFATFLLSSAAVATVIAKLSPYWAMGLALIIAALTAYSLAVALDSKIRTMSKLQSSWGQLSSDYYRLWNRTYADEAEEDFYALNEREHDLSEIAATDAPNDRKRLAHWQEQVFRQHHLSTV